MSENKQNDRSLLFLKYGQGISTLALGDQNLFKSNFIKFIIFGWPLLQDFNTFGIASNETQKEL